MSLPSFIKKLSLRSALSLGIIFIMLLHITDTLPINLIYKLERYTYDVRLNLLMPNTVDNRIVIVDIDEKSLKEQGQWPWSRNKLALLVNQLFNSYQINTLGFDVVFAEKDNSSGLKSLEWLQQNALKNDAEFNKAVEEITPMLDYDGAFAASLKNRKVVLGYYFLENGEKQALGQLPAPSFEGDNFDNNDIAFTEASGFGANLSLLQQHALSAGHFDPAPDSDGISRRVSVLVKYAGKYYASLSMAVAEAYLQAPLETKVEESQLTGYSSLEELKLGDHHIPVDHEVSALIPYRGTQGSFKYVSATDVINHKLPANALKDKIVLVGTTAAGLQDLRATPVQGAYPGVEVHANLIAGILDNNIKKRPQYLSSVEFTLVILAGLLLTFYLPTLSPLKATSFAMLILALILGLVVLCWTMFNLVLPAAALLLMIGLIYFWNMSYGFFVESRGKRQLTGIFGQYVPPELVAEMAENPEKISLVGESREMTVLFSDIRGFTTISEGLDPKQLTQLMGEFLTPLTEVIHRNRGTIDKYMGDAIMAFWGAPMPDNAHATHALGAAMQMQAAVGKINESFAAKGWPAIQIGIGLNTGNMVVGNMGSNFRMAYTVMGDAVNLGSRVEALTKYYSASIVVTEYVKAQTPDMVYCELDLVRVKGKHNAVRIYEPIGAKSSVSQAVLAELALHEEALNSYRNGAFKVAEKQFLALQKSNPKPIYAIYIERIQAFKQSAPPQGWDGVHVFDSK